MTGRQSPSPLPLKSFPLEQTPLLTRLEALYLQPLILQDLTFALPASSPTPAPLMFLRLLRVLIPSSPASTLSLCMSQSILNPLMSLQVSRSPISSSQVSFPPLMFLQISVLLVLTSLQSPCLLVIRLRSRSSSVPQHLFSFPLSQNVTFPSFALVSPRARDLLRLRST